MTPRVLIAGAGVAGLETLLGLRALAGDRVDITLLASELSFVNNSMCAEQPFRPQRPRGVRLRALASEFDACWHRGRLARVDPAQRLVVTRTGARMHYDRLVLAVGAGRERDYSGALTYRDGRDSSSYRLLLQHLHQGRVTRVAFVKPAGATRLLPIYDLALLTAADCAAHERADIELSLVTPEEQPLAAFGRQASETVRGLLAQCGVHLYTSSYALPGRSGQLHLRPGGRTIAVDRIVTEPRLYGRRIPGIPFDGNTFIPTDPHGRVRGLDDVFAAGDVTAFPLRQGGLAAQQADAVAEAIAASFGVDIEPRPFRPILRGALLTGGGARYMRTDISGRAGDDSVISTDPLWCPPTRLAARYLSPYLSSRSGSALDVHLPDAAGPRKDPWTRSFPASEWRSCARCADGRAAGVLRHVDGHAA